MNILQRKMYRGEVYVDGACRGNGQPGARGGLGVHFPDLPSQDVSKELGGDRQTNQRAGIQASIQMNLHICKKKF